MISLLEHSRQEQQHKTYSINPRAGDGMASSITQGVSQTRHWGGWVICLADMPWIQTATYQAIIEAVTPDAIVVPSTQQKGTVHRGNPVGFGKNYRSALEALLGDRGARSVVAAHGDRVKQVNVKDPGILLDIDYPDDINNHANH